MKLSSRVLDSEFKNLAVTTKTRIEIAFSDLTKKRCEQDTENERDNDIHPVHSIHEENPSSID